MNRRPRLMLALVLALLIGACTEGTGGTPGGSSSPTLVPVSPEVVSPAPDGPRSAAAALRRLCTIPEPDLEGDSPVPEEGPTPPAIAATMRQLEQIRGFGFTEPVVAEPVTQREIAQGYLEYFEATFPEDYYERKSEAWRTIGVLPGDRGILESLEEYVTSEVIGYYDTLTGELVFIGTEDPSPLERVTLAHELTHAIDDQRFGLETLDVLGATCSDEESEAATAVVEGNATFFMLRWATTFLTAEEQVELASEAAGQAPPPSDVPPFIDALQAWSYTEGLSFITAIELRGGVDAIDEAFLDLPVSTEQIIHPERYPNDVPTPLDIADLGPDLGPGWEDLDVQAVGESWLSLALALRGDRGEAAEAAAGWDGGLYRAWADGDDVAVVLSTVWDTPRDAEEFASVMGGWISSGGGAAEVLPVDGASVRAVFASDPDVLAQLRAVVD